MNLRIELSGEGADTTLDCEHRKMWTLVIGRPRARRTAPRGRTAARLDRCEARDLAAPRAGVIPWRMVRGSKGVATACIGIALTICLVARSTAAQPDAAAAVPALADEESAPVDLPNYFEARELGAATLAVRVACQDTIAQAVPEADAVIHAAVCNCFADAARWNARVGNRRISTDAQFDRCVEIARKQTASPFIHRFAVETTSIMNMFDACMNELGDAASGTYRGFVCSCATDAWLAHRQDATQLTNDIARCAAAGRYREDTGLNPTTRQFKATSVGRPVERADPGAAFGSERRIPGTFIPYSGNGRGPTLCADGMYSHSSGRGTCSHHGGVAGGRHRHR
jgi:hypothetical protein